MPKWDIDLSDGRTVTVESDLEPSEDEVLSAVGSQPQESPAIGSQFLFAPDPMSPWQRNFATEPRVPSDRTAGEATAANLAMGGVGLQEGFHGLGEQGWTLAQAVNEPIAEFGPISLTPRGLQLTSVARARAKESRETALEARKAAEKLQPLAEEIGGAPIMRTIGQAIPSVAPALATGPLGAAAPILASGAQAGAATLSEGQSVFEQQPEERRKTWLPNTEFWDAAAPAVLDAGQTAALTAVAGKIFGPGIEGATVPAKRAAISSTVTKMVRQPTGEALEEGAQQFISDYVVARMSYNPEMTFEQALDGAIKAAIAGGVVGAGVTSAVAASQTERPPNAVSIEGAPTVPNVLQPEVAQESTEQMPATEEVQGASEPRSQEVAPAEPVTNVDDALRARGYGDFHIQKMSESEKQAEAAKPIPTPEEDAVRFWQIDDAIKAEKDINKRAEMFKTVIMERELIKNRNPKLTGAVPDRPAASVPKEVQESANTWRKAEKRYRRALRQEPSDVADASDARDAAELDFNKLSEKNKISKSAFEELSAFARETDTEQMPEETPATGAIAKSPPLTPSPTPPVKLQPKAQRQIIADLAKGLNIPIRFGRLTTRKFAGYFKPRANLIGSKKAVDIPTVSHEVGHKLDDSLKLSSDPSIATELNKLGDPATPGSASSWTPSKSKAYKLGEGMAELVRYWLTDPPTAMNMAPNAYRAFNAALDANKDFGDVMRQAREDIQLWRNAEPQARLRSQIVSGNPNKTRYTGSQLIRDLVDDLHILRLATEHGAKTSPIDPSKNAYILARNLRGSYGMADTFVRHGVADFNSKDVTLGTSLSDALKPVAGRLNDFRDWIVAKRAQELISQGRETGLVKTDVDTVAARFDSDPEFQKAFDDLKKWNDALLKYAVDSGLITPESAEAMRAMNQDYVPFHRVFEVGAGEAPSQQTTGTGMGLNVGKPGSLKRLSGSTRSIADPLETMVQNAYTLITASEKAAINRAVAGMADLPDMGRWVERVAAPQEAVKVTAEKIRKELEAAGADMSKVPDDLILTFFRAGKTAPFGENTIRVIRDGKQEFYRLNRDLHDTFKALDLEDTGTLIRLLAAPAQLLRSGVVLEPSFNVFNLLRDTFSSAVIGKYGALPFETTFKGVAAMLTKPKAIAEWAASGGKNAVESIYFDRDKLKKFLAERISKDLSPAERALIVAKSPLTALRYMTSVFEEATRVGEYQIALKKLTDSGMPIGEARRLAAFESRDRQDFAKGGAKTKIIRHISAFWNAALQANVKLAQSFKQRPIRTTLQGLAFITIPKLIEQALNWDDDDYWDRPQWERDMFFLIPIGKDETGHTRFLRIPTPFEVGIIFGTFPGRILEWMKTNRPDAMEGFPELVLKNSVPNPMPQSGQMLFEDFLSGPQGWDVWRGRTIVPDSMKDLPPDLQWTEQTSGIAKAIGSRLGYSPMKVDHIIESTTGGLGKLATGRSEPFSRFVTRPLRVSNQPTEDFYIKLEEMRMQAARVKLTGEGEIPDDLKAYERTARTLGELRRELRETKDEKEKAGLQKEMFELISETVKQ